MRKVKLKDVVKRVKDKVNKDSTDLEYYVGGEHIDSEELCITKKGRIEKLIPISSVLSLEIREDQ